MPEAYSSQERHLLIAVGDPHLRALLRNFFATAYQVETAEHAAQAASLVSGRPVDFDVMLVDANLPPSGLDFIARIRSDYPHIPIALLVTREYEHQLALLNKYDVFCVIVRTFPLDFDELQVSIENLLLPTKAFGLGRYLRPPMEVQERLILSLEDKQQLMEDALEFFRRYRPHDTDISQIRLAMEELINNAIYHAFRRASGARKYEMGAFDRLDRGDQIRVEFGADKRYLGCSVTDNQGSLDVGTVMKKIERQITQEGILDESGRGLYLTRTLSDKMIVNIHPNVATQVVLLFSRRDPIKIKPFFVNQVRTI